MPKRAVFLSVTGSSVQPAWPPEFAHFLICSLLTLHPARLLVVRQLVFRLHCDTVASSKAAAM